MDVTTILLQMQEQAQENHTALADKVDEGLRSIAAAMAKHELEDTKLFSALDNRVVIVENTRRTFRWLGATVLVAFIGGIIDLVFVHLPKFFQELTK